MKKLFLAVFVLTAWYSWAGASGEHPQTVEPDSPYSRRGTGGEYFQTVEPDSLYSRTGTSGERFQSVEPDSPSYSWPGASGESLQVSARPNGDIGVDTRDEIAWRKEWVERLGECDRYVADYIRNTPLPTLLVYSAAPEKGAIDWERETAAFSFRIALHPDKNWPLPLKSMMNGTYSAFAATGKARAWGIAWPTRAVSGDPSPIRAETVREYLAAVELVNGQGQVIGTQSVSLSAGWKTGFTGPDAPLLDNEGLGIDTASHEPNATAASIQTVKTVTFPYVSADKITGGLSVRIVRLNGKSVETAAQAAQVSVMTEAAYAQVLERQLNMISVRGGAFMMGGTDKDEQPRHQETRRPFSMGKYEVTVGEYRAYLNYTGQKVNLYGSDDMPANGISWFDAIRYCNWLSRMTGRQPVYTINRKGNSSRNMSPDDVTWDPGANGYRLPTEAEWEYACRAGTTAAYSFGNSISASQARYRDRSQQGRGQPVPVGSFAPNPWGFHDMHGNVGEWCWDYNERHGSFRCAVRGGGYLSWDEHIRSSSRQWDDPGGKYGAGFRVVRSSF